VRLIIECYATNHRAYQVREILRRKPGTLEQIVKDNRATFLA
jgi:hypothetical protein